MMYKPGGPVGLIKGVTLSPSSPGLYITSSRDYLGLSVFQPTWDHEAIALRIPHAQSPNECRTVKKKRQ